MITGRRATPTSVTVARLPRMIGQPYSSSSCRRVGKTTPSERMYSTQGRISRSINLTANFVAARGLA